MEVFAYSVQETKNAKISLDGVTSPYWTDQGISHKGKSLKHAVDLESGASSDEAEPRGGVAPASGSTAGIAPDSGSAAGAATSAASGGDDGDRVPSLQDIAVVAVVDRYLYTASKAASPSGTFRAGRAASASAAAGGRR